MTQEESKSEKEINKHGGRREEIAKRERNAGQPADSEHQGAQTSNAETPDTEATRTTCDANGKRKTSYRRPNRNCSTHVDWTYELNKDIYRIYLEIKPSERGYMKRLKEMWDKEHPQLSHMTAKHLAVQVDRVIKKKLIRETGYIEQDATLECEMSNHQENINEREIQTEPDEEPTSPLRQARPENRDTPQMEIDQNLYNDITSEWKTNFDKFYTQDIKERTYQTRIDRTINANNLAAMNKVLGEQLAVISDNDNGLSLWDLDVAYYAAAITLLQREGKLKEVKRMRRKMEKPGWQINLEQHIESTGRRLSFIDLILKCKQQGKYTSHQRKIESKLKKWYRKTTKENLTRVRTMLKQDLKSFSEKLRRKKVVQERRIINRKFTTNSKAVYRKFKAGENIEVKDPPTKEETEAF